MKKASYTWFNRTQIMGWILINFQDWGGSYGLELGAFTNQKRIWIEKPRLMKRWYGNCKQLNEIPHYAVLTGIAILYILLRTHMYTSFLINYIFWSKHTDSSLCFFCSVLFCHFFFLKWTPSLHLRLIFIFYLKFPINIPDYKTRGKEKWRNSSAKQEPRTPSLPSKFSPLYKLNQIWISRDQKQFWIYKILEMN